MSVDVPVDERDKPDWVCYRAVRWVIDEAPVPADLAWTLVVIARRTNEDGTGSYQSIPTLATKTGKSEDQVRRDIKALLDRGLISLGDQTLPEKNGVPAGKRPVVYDVSLHLSGPKPTRNSKNPSGGKRLELVEPEGTPGIHATPGVDATPCMDAYDTPRMDATPTPRMDATQTKPLNKPVKQPIERDGPAKKITSRQKADAEGWRMLTVLRSYTPDQARHIIGELNRKHRIFSAQWWKEAHANGTLDDRIQEVIDEYLENQAARAARQEAA